MHHDVIIFIIDLQIFYDLHDMHYKKLFFFFFSFVKTVEAKRPRPSPLRFKPYYFAWGFLKDVSDCLSHSAHLLFLLRPYALFLAPNSEALSQIRYSDPIMEDRAIVLTGSKEEVQSISDWFADFHDMRQGVYSDTSDSSR